MSESSPEKKSERRFTERYKIPDGLIYFRQLRKINWINSFLGPCDLNDIASNSVSFESPRVINDKQEVELKIVLPGNEKGFQVKGTISRKNTNTNNGLSVYVVQFSPFGKGYQYNSYISRDKVREFIKAVESKNEI